jgi:hypothetical protein
LCEPVVKKRQNEPVENKHNSIKVNHDSNPFRNVPNSNNAKRLMKKQQDIIDKAIHILDDGRLQKRIMECQEQVRQLEEELARLMRVNVERPNKKRKPSGPARNNNNNAVRQRLNQ